MKVFRLCLAASMLALAGIGCSNEPTEEEEKAAAEAMQKQDEELRELLPANID